MILSYRAKNKQHDWQPTERQIPGAILKLHGCKVCREPHVKAYDMEVTSRESFKGRWEYEERNKKEEDNVLVSST